MPVLEGYYISETDLKSYIKSAELTAITEEIGTDTHETNVQAAIKNICSSVDATLKNRYNLPLADTYDLKPLKAAICKIVVWEISGLYSSLGEEQRKQRSENKVDGWNFIEDLASGKKDLINSADTNTEADKYAFQSNAVRIDESFR